MPGKLSVNYGKNDQLNIQAKPNLERSKCMQYVNIYILYVRHNLFIVLSISQIVDVLCIFVHHFWPYVVDRTASHRLVGNKLSHNEDLA